jgi:5-methylcytosine-specific restriction enzyme subunit McrC
MGIDSENDSFRKLPTSISMKIEPSKSKIVYSDEKDLKKGISQNVLYQMLAYAVRFEVDKIILFYSNTIKQNQQEETELKIKDALANRKKISIRAFQLPIINRELLESDLNNKTDLSELFESTRQELINKIVEVFYCAQGENSLPMFYKFINLINFKTV